MPKGFSGAGVPGLDQINIGPLPRSLGGTGKLDIVLSVDGKKANPVSISITGVTQDEPVGTTCPDATGVGTASTSLRAERLGDGDGRVYHVSFNADDARGGHCGGTVMVCVPHDQQPGHVCMDQGALFDSTVCP